MLSCIVHYYDCGVTVMMRAIGMDTWADAHGEWLSYKLSLVFIVYIGAIQSRSPSTATPFGARSLSFGPLYLNSRSRCLHPA